MPLPTVLEQAHNGGAAPRRVAPPLEEVPVLTRTHAVAGPGHPEHHRVAHSFEALMAIGIVVAGIAAVVGIIGFLTGSWMLGSATFPALLILTVIIGIFAMGRGAKHDDPTKEVHDVD